jgi:hypothetical protein
MSYLKQQFITIKAFALTVHTLRADVDDVALIARAEARLLPLSLDGTIETAQGLGS